MNCVKTCVTLNRNHAGLRKIRHQYVHSPWRPTVSNVGLATHCHERGRHSMDFGCRWQSTQRLDLLRWFLEHGSAKQCSWVGTKICFPHLMKFWEAPKLLEGGNYLRLRTWRTRPFDRNRSKYLMAKIQNYRRVVITDEWCWEMKTKDTIRVIRFTLPNVGFGTNRRRIPLRYLKNQIKQKLF